MLWERAALRAFWQPGACLLRMLYGVILPHACAWLYEAEVEGHIAEWVVEHTWTHLETFKPMQAHACSAPSGTRLLSQLCCNFVSLMRGATQD